MESTLFWSCSSVPNLRQFPIYSFYAKIIFLYMCLFILSSYFYI